MKRFHINEDDLQELESILPQWADNQMVTMDNRVRAQFRRVQTILLNVRWNYGPWTDVEVIPADEPPAE